MPWIIMAPSISAITGLGGIPIANSGMKEVCAPALLAEPGPATPSTAPWPKRDGSRATFFSTTYAANELMSAPPPGSTPSTEPMPVPRSTAGQA
jgi:hypothetical protein